MNKDDVSIGMLLPSGNIVAEGQVRAMTPAGVTVHTTRLPLTGSSDAELQRMTESLEGAAGLLADARVDLIAFNCTAVSTYSSDADCKIADRITAATKTPAVTTAQALVAALLRFDCKRVVLVTPYLEPVTRREEAFLAHQGFDVIHSASYGINLNWDMAHEPPETWTRFVKAHRRPEADAYLLSCTAIRSAEVIDELEAVLQQPVITSNQALVWYCLHSLGIKRDVAGFGRLLRRDDQGPRGRPAR